MGRRPRRDAGRARRPHASLIVVDSSVWIANLRGLDTASVRRLRAIDHENDQVLVGDLILLEVLQGARDGQHAGRIEQALCRYPIVPMLDPNLAILAAKDYRILRGLGITGRLDQHLERSGRWIGSG